MTRLVSNIKRISIFFIAFVFLFCSVFLISQPKKVQAVEPVTLGVSAIIAVVCAGLAASGLALNTTASSPQSFKEAIQNLSENFSYNGKRLMDFYGSDYDRYVNVYKSKYDDQYTLLANQELADWIFHFKDYLVNEYSLTNVSSPLYTVYNFVDSNGHLVPYISNPNSNITLAQLKSANSVMPITTSTSAGTSFSFSLNNTNYGFTVTQNQPNFTSSYGLIKFSKTVGESTSNVQTTYYRTLAKLLFVYTGTHLLSYVYSQSSSTGVYSGTVLLDITISDLLTDNIGIEGSLADGYQDYSDAMNDAIQENFVGVNVGELDDATTAEGYYDNYLNRIVSTGVIDGTLVGGYEDERQAEEDIDGERIPTAGELESNIVVVDGLEDFFPFCIPWDLYNIIQILNVEPVAPKFTYKVDLTDTAIDAEYEAELDLAPFETVAVVFRAFIIVAFLIFLILKTRDLIRG